MPSTALPAAPVPSTREPRHDDDRAPDQVTGGGTRLNAVLELAALYRCRPGLHATPTQTAAWYVAKGRLHEGLAAEMTGPERAAELIYATAAQEHARRIGVA